MEAERYDEAQAKSDQCRGRLREAWRRLGQPMLAAMGLPMGPSRPPSLPTSDAQIAAAKKAMLELGWIS